MSDNESYKQSLIWLSNQIKSVADKFGLHEDEVFVELAEMES